MAYNSIAAAQAGETESVTADTTAAGTTDGIVVGTGPLSAIDDFFKDFWLVLTDATPGNGLVCRYARVSRYVGATQTFTLDQPWDFGVGETYEIINPVRIALRRDLTEDVVFTKNVELNLEGHRLKGSVDQTTGSFCWIREGWVTNGIQKTNIGVLRLEDLSVSRRDDTFEAVLMTHGSDLGRAVLRNCNFTGRVVSRRGRSGWEIHHCKAISNMPASETVSGSVGAYLLVDSQTGIPITLNQFDLSIDSEFNGAFFNVEGTGSITGGAAFISIEATIHSPRADYLFGQTFPPSDSSRVRTFQVIRASGAATFSVTASAGAIVIAASHGFAASTAGDNVDTSDYSLIYVKDFSGTVTLTSNLLILKFSVFSTSRMSIITANGMTAGSITFDGSSPRLFMSADPVGTGTPSMGSLGGIHYFHVLNTVTAGSMTIGGSAPIFINGGGFCPMRAESNSTGGAPNLTVSAETNFRGNFFSMGNNLAPTGAWVMTWSGSLRAVCLGPGPAINPWRLLGSAGTFTFSGQIDYTDDNAGGGQLVNHGGTGGTINISGTFLINRMRAGGTIAGNSSTGTINISSAIVRFRHVQSGPTIVNHTGAGTTSVTGAVTIFGTFADTATTLITHTAGTVNGPSSVTLMNCHYLSSFTMDTGAGVLNWAGVSFFIKNCQVDGLFTFVGTNFSTFEAFETFFNGNTSDESVTATGTRPTTYRYWACHFRAQYRDLLPEVLYDWITAATGAALTAGQLATINAAGNAVDTTATSVVEGVVLEAAGAGTVAVLVRRGDIFVDSQAGGATGVNAGDNTGLDTGTPTQQEETAAVAGQRIGRALEATAATRAGEAYTIVNLM